MPATYSKTYEGVDGRPRTQQVTVEVRSRAVLVGRSLNGKTFSTANPWHAPVPELLAQQIGRDLQNEGYARVA